jgi:hypothetical protein
MSGDTIQFFDGVFPQLKASTYEAQLQHEVSGGPAGAPSFSASRKFTVEAPQFAIDPGAIVSTYPPDGSVGDYGSVLPFVVLDDETLPWERSLVQHEEQPGADDPTPWMALLVLEDDDLVLMSGQTELLASGPVAKLLEPTPGVFLPKVELPDESVVARAITIKGERFGAMMPTSTDIVHLAHCRRVSTGVEQGVAAVVVANRLPEAPAGDRVYRAHLVSLEGLRDAITPAAEPPERQEGGGPMDVTLISLASWSFTSTKEGAPFESLVQGLIESQAPSPGLSVPVPIGASPLPSVPAPVSARLADGYVPLEYGLPSGEATVAWYRGPLTPVVPQPLSAPAAKGSDALLIYSAAEGVFDVSYAAAWQLGRCLGLADSAFTDALGSYRQAARSAAAQLGQRRTVAHLAGAPAGDLLAPNPSRRRLIAALGDGLGERWTAALREAADAAPAAPPPPVAEPERGAAAVAAALEGGEGAAALGERLAEPQDPVAGWLAGLALLEPVPFANLVPDPSMLPGESVRFFYVDGSFQQAMAAGAMSIGVQGSADVALDEALRPSLERAVAARREAAGATGAPLSGMLIRSALVPAWPTLVVVASQAGNALPVVRRATLGEDVLLCLWSGVPDAVSLAEPYQGLRFGIEDAGIALRSVTPGSVGEPCDVTVPVAHAEGRLDVTALASTIAAKLKSGQLGAGDLAIQLVLAPERQTFPSGGAA